MATVSVLNGSDILVTGGTGSFGRAFVRHALDNLSPRRLIIFSRDEQRLLRTMHNVDHVVHAAALKQVDTAE